MHAALIIGTEAFDAERAWYDRTVSALMTTGIRITRVLPVDGRFDDRLALAPQVPYGGVCRWWALRPSQRWATLCESFDGGITPDLVHAIGQHAWRPALALAESLERPLAISVWDAKELPQIARLARRDVVAGVLTATPPMAEALRHSIDASLVRCVPLGVYAVERRAPANEARGNAVACIVAGRGASLPAIKAFLTGCAEAIGDDPEFMIFADLDRMVEDKAWRHAQSGGLEGRFSLIPPVGRDRLLPLESDLIVVPEATHRASTFVLEAMARRRPVVAARDGVIPALDDASITTLIESGESAEWRDTISAFRNSPASFRDLANRASDWVSDNHAMNSQTELLADTYRWLAKGGAVPLEASVRRSR
ncbi:MAG: hypothetical protein ACF8PN_04215 [Phycisphaerales bacterium]